MYAVARGRPERALKKNGAYALFRARSAPDFEPVWPEKWPPERLRARKDEIGSASFARGYRLVPIADEETPIRAAWVRFWTEPAEYDTVLLSVDPAVSSSAKADCSALVGARAARRAPGVGGRAFTCWPRRARRVPRARLVDADRRVRPLCGTRR